MVEIDEQDLEELYSWIDQIPLSRPKKDLKRDFSDGGVCICCSVLTSVLSTHAKHLTIILSCGYIVIPLPMCSS